MVYQVRVFRLPNGALAIAFLLARTVIAVVPSAVKDLVDAVLGGVSGDRASLDQILSGPHKGRWTLTILGSVFRMDECDVIALRAELGREFSH